jgi:hypothetical protein
MQCERHGVCSGEQRSYARRFANGNVSRGDLAGIDRIPRCLVVNAKPRSAGSDIPIGGTQPEVERDAVCRRLEELAKRLDLLRSSDNWWQEQVFVGPWRCIDDQRLLRCPRGRVPLRQHHAVTGEEERDANYDRSNEVRAHSVTRTFATMFTRTQ